MSLDPRTDAWVVSEQGGDFRLAFAEKDEAITFAVQRARAHVPAQVKVHAPDGRIEADGDYEEEEASQLATG